MQNTNVSNSNTNLKNNKFIYLIIALIVVGAVGGGIWYWYSSHYISTDDARISGTIAVANARSGGRLVELTVKEGQHVNEGDLIARLDSDELIANRQKLLAELSVAEANYNHLINISRPEQIASAQANLAAFEAQLDYYRENNRRMNDLFKKGAIAADQRDQSDATKHSVEALVNDAKEKLNLLVAGAHPDELQAAAAKLAAAKAAVGLINIQINNLQVLAPKSGYVAQKNVTVGEVVGAGQPLCSIVDENDLWLNARIEETKIEKIRAGCVVDYTIDAYPGINFQGKVLEINPATISVFALIPTENVSGTYTKVTQRIPVKISLPENSSYDFRPGMSALVKIHAI